VEHDEAFRDTMVYGALVGVVFFMFYNYAYFLMDRYEPGVARVEHSTHGYG